MINHDHLPFTLISEFLPSIFLFFARDFLFLFSILFFVRKQSKYYSPTHDRIESFSGTSRNFFSQRHFEPTTRPEFAVKFAPKLFKFTLTRKQTFPFVWWWIKMKCCWGNRDEKKGQCASVKTRPTTKSRLKLGLVPDDSSARWNFPLKKSTKVLVAH